METQRIRTEKNLTVAFRNFAEAPKRGETDNKNIALPSTC
jgi:hypothetical protein